MTVDGVLVDTGIVVTLKVNVFFVEEIDVDVFLVDIHLLDVIIVREALTDNGPVNDVVVRELPPDT